jgi:SAM-dependent methyltransferase
MVACWSVGKAGSGVGPAPASPYNAGDLRKFIVDIGCGDNKRPGAIGLDIARLESVDVIGDVRAGLPFRDSSLDGVYASHLLEHFDDLVAVMEDVWRVLKPAGRLYVTVPHASSSFMTWRDPTHRRGVNLSTLTYFDRSTFEGSMFRYYSRANFRLVYSRLRFAAGGPHRKYPFGRNPIAKLMTDFLETVANRSPYAQYLCERWWGPIFGIAEAYAILEAVKPASLTEAAAPAREKETVT